MRLDELLNALAAKCGKQNDLSVIDVLGRCDLRNIAIKEDVAKSILNDRLPIEEIKKSAFAKRHFTALALSAVDMEIMRSVKDLQLGDSFEKELSMVNNTYEKHRKLLMYVKGVIDKLKSKYEEQLIDLTIKLKLSGVNYVNTSIPVEYNILLAKVFLEKELKGNAVIVWENNRLALKKFKNRQASYTDDEGREVLFDDFMDKILSVNGLLRNE